MMNKLILAFMLFPIMSFAESQAVYFGEFRNWYDVEYESSFTPCGSGEMWSIEGGAAHKELMGLNSKLGLTPFDSIYVKIKLIPHLVDRKIYPNSHYDFTAQVSELVERVTDEKQIRACNE
jgi:hypothetical protein